MLKLKLFWPPNAKSQLIWKDSDARKDWRQKEKGETEDKMVRQHLWLTGQEFEQTLEDSEERLACGRPWDSKVGHDLATEQQQPLVVVREALN